MSGGVDSSVTAYLLKEQGYEVEGLSLNLWDTRNAVSSGQCCSLESAKSAASTASILGIPHVSLDVRQEFIEKVVEPFAETYLRGMTPNPCILCNRLIKFPALLGYAEQRQAEFIATGHYAIVERDGSARFTALRRGVDPSKDQSYVLYVIGRDNLERLLLPLGGYRKEQVREIAKSLGLPAADREESQEICFIEGDYAEFIETLAPDSGRTGPILDASGNVIGTHKGLHHYTVGQRKGLGIYRPEPLFVTELDHSRNALRVGSREEAMTHEFSCGELIWISQPATNPFRAEVKVRSMMDPKPAKVEAISDCARVTFDEPQWAVAAGQSAVFYEGDAVLGGGIICPASKVVS